MVKLVNFTLCAFYHNKERKKTEIMSLNVKSNGTLEYRMKMVPSASSGSPGADDG